VNYVSYFRKAGGCLQRMCNLSGTCDTWVVVCRDVYTVSYIRKVGGCLWGVSELCQLHQEVGGCLQGMCNLSGTFDLHETGWRFSAGCVLTLSVAQGRLVVVCWVCTLSVI
jgi:hypothetical protein